MIKTTDYLRDNIFLLSENFAIVARLNLPFRIVLENNYKKMLMTISDIYGFFFKYISNNMLCVFFMPDLREKIAYIRLVF